LIILDTNALIYSVKQRVNLENFLDEEIAVPTSALRELKSLSRADSDARLALKVAERYKVLEVSSQGDEGVIEAAVKYNGKVVTNDRALQQQLKEKGIRVTSVTGKMVRRL